MNFAGADVDVADETVSAHAEKAPERLDVRRQVSIEVENARELLESVVDELIFVRVQDANRMLEHHHRPFALTIS